MVRPREAPGSDAGADVRQRKLADDSALCLHDLGHIVIQPGHDLDHFRLTLRVRGFLGQIAQ